MTTPKSNRDWWEAKLDANVARDRKIDDELAALDWEVIRIWEHEDTGAAAKRIHEAYSARLHAHHQSPDFRDDQRVELGDSR